MTKRGFLILFLTLFTAISILGIGVNMAVYNTDMAVCPLMGELLPMCQMEMSEHIGYWQNLFTAKVNDTNTLILWLLAISLPLAIYRPDIRHRAKTPLDLSFNLYNKTNPQTHLFNYLNLLFSKGILQPKIY